MTTVDDAAILKRAKEICAKNGVSWDWQRSGRPSLDQDGRRRHLAIAREQLLSEEHESHAARNTPVA